MYRLVLQNITAQFRLHDATHSALFIEGEGASLVMSTRPTQHYRLDIGPRGGLTVTPIDTYDRAEWINNAAPSEP